MDEKKEKYRKNYHLATSFPLVIAILHFIFSIVFQATSNVTEDGILHGYTLGGMFSISAFTTMMVSSSSIVQIRSVMGVTSLAVGLPIIILTMYFVKKRKDFVLYILLMYLLDFLFSFACIIVNNVMNLNYKLSAIDITLMFFIHTVSLILLAIALYFEKKKEDEIVIKKDDVLFMGDEDERSK